ncbi:MAG: hypothetical protein PQJ50_01055 [Spirochaetales bacterium]|nr:hypothetical protein [Spirochaetales bacterium]
MPVDDCEVEVNFKVYKEFSLQSGNIVGNKETSETLSDGYVYIYRQIRPNEENEDGSRTRIYEIVTLSKKQRTSLPKVIDGYENHFFFAYSRIRLSDSRVTNLRLSLDELIKKRKQHSTMEYILNPEHKITSHRLTYIPTAYDMVDNRLFASDDRVAPFAPSGSRNCDFSLISTSNTTIYLHDWYKYLKNLADEYQSLQGKYSTLLEEPVNLSDYYNGSSDMNFSDIKDLPSRGELYEFTKVVKQLSEGIGKINNLRKTREGNKGRNVIYKHDFQRFLDEIDTEEMETALSECRSKVKEINTLLINPQRSIHHCLYDYFFGTEQETQDALEVLGRSIHNNNVLLDVNDAEQFRSQLLGEIENKENCLEVDDIDDMIKTVGDNNAFNFPVSSLVSYSTAETVMILDNILQHAPYFKAQPPVIEIIRNVTFKEALIESPVLYMDEVSLKKWYFSQYETTTYMRTRAYEMWHTHKRTTIVDFDSHYTATMDVLDDTALVVIQSEVLDTNAESLETKLKYGTKLTKEALGGLAKILDGFNMIKQVNSLFDMQKGDKLGGFISLAGSSISVFQKPLTTLVLKQRVSSILKVAQSRTRSYTINTVNKLATNQTGKIVGSAGTALYAIEMGYVAFKRAGQKDEDAAAFFGAASFFAVASIAVSFVPGLNVAVWVLMGVSFIFSILGTIFTDDHIDLFLKYCFWGKEFHSLPSELPSWWINLESEENIDDGVLTLDDTFDKIDTTKRDDEYKKKYRLLSMDKNLSLIKRVIQIPSYDIGLGSEMPFDYAVAKYIKVKIEKIDFAKIKSIDLKLLQAPGPRTGFSRFVSPKVDLNGMQILYSKSFTSNEIKMGLYKAGGAITVNRAVNSISEADSYEIIFVQDFKDVQKKVSDFTSGHYGAESSSFYNNMSKEEFKSHFNINAEIVEIKNLTYDENGGNNPTLNLSHNKIIEATFEYYTPTMMPVRYRKGINRS